MQELLRSPPDSLRVVYGHHELSFTASTRQTDPLPILLWGMAALGAFVILLSSGWVWSSFAVPVLLFPIAPLVVAAATGSRKTIRLSERAIVIGRWSADLADVRSCTWSSFTGPEGLTANTLALGIGRPGTPEPAWRREAWSVSLDEAEGRWLCAAVMALAAVAPYPSTNTAT